MQHKVKLALIIYFTFFEFVRLENDEKSASENGSTEQQQSEATKQTEDTKIEWDPNGYVFFCLCMGRFGNQADHFLGGLAFAKNLNRTLVLPPFRTYRNVGFDEWFKVKPLREYHRVILAEHFMRHLAPLHWPVGSRIGWCWQADGSMETKCNMKQGNPFGPFWDGVGVDFDSDLIYHLGYYDNDVQNWINMYPASKYPVMAFRGAPAVFPVRPEHRDLQRYLVLSDKVNQMADDYVQQNFPNQTFVGLHLRNGPDWENACGHAEGTPRYMASPQCLGNTKQSVTTNLCIPPLAEVLRLTKNVVIATRAKVVFVATDKKAYTAEIEAHLEKQKVKVYHADPWLPLEDLGILIKSDHFIGNCISSFTAFAKRARDVEGKPSSFWGFS